MHHLLETSREDKETLLTTALFYPDKAGSFASVDVDKNNGAYLRYLKAKLSNVHHGK